jgi:poly-gamma-glutamate synthesis protein (capsule biosynthesis protein)
MDRRCFLINAAKTLALLSGARFMGASAGNPTSNSDTEDNVMDTPTQQAGKDATNPITLFLCGDVMTGRGIDQILPHPSAPEIHESYMRSAKGYLKLAEQLNGPIPKPVDFTYIWGDALEEFERMAPDVKIINLETAVTTSNDWQEKGINYRMHPNNIPCITAAGIDCCVLANNHVLDWGEAGLIETLDTLERAGLQQAGAGKNIQQAEQPAIIPIQNKGRAIIFSFGHGSSGIPFDWAATKNRPGLNRLHDLSKDSVQRIASMTQAIKKPGDILVASIHWGSNWGYHIPADHIAFAHALIDEAGIDIIHGHSSHHPIGIEVYRNRPIFYGCGDFLNDYEGIHGMERFRGDLALMYFPVMDPSSGKLLRLEMIPTQTKRFRVNRATLEDATWLLNTLNRVSNQFRSSFTLEDDQRLNLQWA